MDISISCQRGSFIVICTSDPLERFHLQTLSLSLFMSRVGANYYNPSPSTYQSTFFTNFTNGSPYFHICYSLIFEYIYIFLKKKTSFFKF